MVTGISDRKAKVVRGVVLAAILLLAGFVRLGELRTYGPTPGDDTSYLNGVKEGYSAWRRLHPSPSNFLRFFSPFAVANDLARKSYEQMAFTSLAKPLYMLKLAAIEGTVGLTLYRQQLSLAISGIAMVLVLFSIARRLFGPVSGLIAAFLAALSPWLVRYSTYGVPTMDSLLFLLLVFRAIIARRFSPFLAGALLGTALLINPTVVWPAGILLGLGALRWWMEEAGRALPGRLTRGTLRGWLILGGGVLLPPLLWEALGLVQSSLLGAPYRPFWAAFGQTVEDNAFHAILLPVDPLFWFRLLTATEGWPQAVLWPLALVWTAASISRALRADRFPRLALLAAMLGTIAAATWSGSTQCARHYVLAWPLGLAVIGGMAGEFLKGRFVFSGGKRFLLGAALAVILLAALLSDGERLRGYRYSRQGGYRLSEWIRENVPRDRMVTPANQPSELWPEVSRFHNWRELMEREKKGGPLYVVYGDYLAITRGIWDYPFELFQVAQACRAIEGEVFRAGTHLSSPSFLYENEDYYWGFVRQKKEVFDPDLRVIPASVILPFRENPPRPPDAVTINWEHANGDHGTNIYWSFVRFAVFPFRGASPPLAFILALFFLLLLLVWPAPSDFVRRLKAAGIPLSVALILAVAVVFRLHGLKRFSQMGGDDVEYRTYVEKGRTFPLFQGRGVAAPFVLAVHLTQLDVNKTITSMAKPLFLLERCLLEYTLGSSIGTIQLWTCLEGLVAVFLIFGLGRRVAGNGAGLIAAFVWAVSPWAATYSTWGIPAAGGALWFILALWLYQGSRAAPSLVRFFLAGLFLGISIFYSSSDLWPGFCLLIVDAGWRLCRLYRGPRRREIVLGGVALLGGAAAVWLGWEALSKISSRLVQSPYIPYHRLLAGTVRDNLLHSRTLPVDFLFFWRYLFVSEGPLAGAAAVGALAWAVWALARRRAPEGVGTMLALFFGSAVVINYTGGSQVIRHFFPSWIPLAVIMGAAAEDLAGRRPALRWIGGALLIFLLFSQWRRLETFRLARWAPDRVKAWAWINFIPHGVATLACQDMTLWPGLRPIASREELAATAARTPPGAMMYSDYIEIAHGSWFYTLKEYYEISEVARRSSGDLFRTPSYLSYIPSRFENEFYYWGLWRDPFPAFDPAIRLLPASALLENWDRIRSDPRMLENLWAPTKIPPPLRLPARPDDILRPFLVPRPRPSYALHLIVSLAAFVALAVAAQCREGRR